MKFRPYHASRARAPQRPCAIDRARDPGMSFPHPLLMGLFKNTIEEEVPPGKPPPLPPCQGG